LSAELVEQAGVHVIFGGYTGGVFGGGGAGDSRMRFASRERGSGTLRLDGSGGIDRIRARSLRSFGDSVESIGRTRLLASSDAHVKHAVHRRVG
jgi:hypothetical protein